MWRLVVWYKFADITEERNSSIFNVESQAAKQALSRAEKVKGKIVPVLNQLSTTS
jgi:hypothetical protein